MILKRAKDCKCHLCLQLVDSNLIMSHLSVHDILPCRQVNVPFLKVNVRSVVSFDHLLQRDSQLLSAVLSLPAQLLNG